MGTKLNVLPVYTVDVFAADKTFFWMGKWCSTPEAYQYTGSPYRQMFYSLIQINDPGGTIAVDDEIISPGPHHIICIRPGSIVSVNISRGAKGHLICFTENFFSLRYNNNVLQRFGFLNNAVQSAIILGEAGIKRWHSLIDLMADEYTGHPGDNFAVLRSYLNIILYELDKCSMPPVIAEKISAGFDKVKQFEKLIDTHYASLKTPAAYASRLYISTNYLNKLCRVYHGITAGELIRKRVALEARRLLHYTHQSVGEIGYQLGFESLSYFVTFFKKNTGVTPEAFRKEHV